MNLNIRTFEIEKERTNSHLMMTNYLELYYNKVNKNRRHFTTVSMNWTTSQKDTNLEKQAISDRLWTWNFEFLSQNLKYLNCNFNFSTWIRLSRQMIHDVFFNASIFEVLTFLELRQIFIDAKIWIFLILINRRIFAKTI